MNEESREFQAKLILPSSFVFKVKGVGVSGFYGFKRCHWDVLFLCQKK